MKIRGASQPVGAILILAVSLFTVAAQSSGPGSLTVDDILTLSKAGIPEDVICNKIRANAKAFDLNPAEILELKKAGISDLIINLLINPSYKPEPPAPAPAPAATKPNPPAAPSPPPPPTKHYPADDHAGKVPPEPGLYRFPASVAIKTTGKVLLSMQEGGALGKVLLKKPRTIAYLVGPAAETRISDPNCIFYLRLPEGKSIEDFILVMLDRKGERRELEMGPAGPKQPDVRRQFDSTEVGASLFKLTVAKLAKGEYLFFQLGSAEQPKGISGRGFDFGVDERPR